MSGLPPFIGPAAPSRYGYVPVYPDGPSNSALAKPGGQGGNGNIVSGRSDYHPWIIRRRTTFKEVILQVTTAGTAGTADIGWHANTINNGIWTPGPLLETIATGLSLTTPGGRVQSWARTVEAGVYWSQTLALGLTGGPVVRGTAGCLPFVPQANANAAHAIGYTESGLSALANTPNPVLSTQQLASPAFMIN